MGCFSWMFCNRDNKVALKIGRKGYLLLPDDTCIMEEVYNGYGVFGGKDVYALVAEWNREHLTEDMLRRPRYDRGDNEDVYRYNMDYYITAVCRLYDYKSGKYTDEEMQEKYGMDWKRELGINIACYDEQNAALPFPIKISSAKRKYSEMPPSISDRNQGCF